MTVKHLYQNEVTIAGDIVDISKNILQGKSNWIKYSVILSQKYRFKQDVQTRLTLIDFFRHDEDKELESLKVGDNIIIFGKINSREYEGKYYTSVNGNGFVMVNEAEKEKEEEKEVEQTTSQAKQGKLDDQDNDEDVPF